MKKTPRYWVLGILIGVLNIGISSLAYPRELVLVGEASANYPPFSAFEIRKIFLGYPVKKENSQVYGIINKTDDESYQVFLQKLIHMSVKNYERLLLSKTFRTGAPTVAVETTMSMLKSELLNDTSKVTVLWRTDLEVGDGLMSIQTLWIEH